jgi:Activator of Hsp90 ATPase homolog 1-like protein
MSEQFEMGERTIVIERDLDAPRELVWRVWTDPDEVTKWWGPEHFTTPREKIEFDLRPGGVCRMTMVGPDGVEYHHIPHDLRRGAHPHGPGRLEQPTRQARAPASECVSLISVSTNGSRRSRTKSIGEVDEQAGGGNPRDARR